MERDHLAGSIVRRGRLLGVGVAPGDQPLGVQGRPRYAALAGKPLADVRVDPLAQFMARGYHPGALTLFRRESEPARRHRADDVVGSHLC